MSYLAPRNRPSVLAFAGDSTMISGFAMSGWRTAGDRPAVADYIAAHFQQCQAPTHFLDVKVHHDRQFIMMARFYPIKQFPNGKEFRFLRSRVRARTRTRVRVYTRLRSRACAREVGKLLQHILYGLHEFCAVLDELMTADGEWVLDTPRDAEHLASLLARHARRDQRAAALRRLNHNDAEAKAADDAIAHRKPTRQRQRPVLGLGDNGARRGDRLRQLRVLGRIDPVQSRCHDGDRWTPPLQGAPVRRGIDATGQPADHHHPGIGQVARQAVGGAPAVRGRVPRADDRDHRLGWELPPDEEPRRRVMDLLEPRRIIGIVEPNAFSLSRLRGRVRVAAHPLSRYCSASATCACAMSLHPSRSAMVRATRCTRWTARPLSCSRSAAASKSPCPRASNAASALSCGPVSA